MVCTPTEAQDAALKVDKTRLCFRQMEVERTAEEVHTFNALYVPFYNK